MASRESGRDDQLHGSLLNTISIYKWLFFDCFSSQRQVLRKVTSAPARFDKLKLVVIYIDGMVFGDHVMIGAVGVDAEGHKHVLAITVAAPGI